MAKRRKEEMADEDILSLLQNEWESSLGEGDQLEVDRARALDYIHGDPDRGYMKEDMKPQPGLSKATSSDVSDAIETVLPDLIEIFTGGEDVVTFAPKSEEDEPQAEQETDYINHAFYVYNDGWMILYTAFKDALTSKSGIIKWWWEVEEEEEYRTVEIEASQQEAFEAYLETQGEGWSIAEEDDTGDEDEDETEEDDAEAAMPAMFGELIPQMVSVRLVKTTKRGRPRVAAVPPEDFRVDPAAASLATATWAAMRSTARVWQLAEAGLDRELLESLPAETVDGDEQTDAQARDFQNEVQTPSIESGNPDMKLVETREYHIWLDIDGDGEAECWRVITGGEDTVLLKKERISGIQFADICPFPLTHRFYGRSLADLTTEFQKLKTAFLRITANHSYFSVNPRPEVAMDFTNEVTVKDLLNNVPGSPVRSKNGQAVRWINPPALGVDPLQIIEYLNTASEMRTGVVRNAQGLNPDTLHDTAKGAMELMGAAQRRVRLIARIFAETGLKRFFLGLHDLIVKHADKADYVRLRNGYVDVDPSKWGRRSDLTIDVGLGTNTKTYEMQFWQLILELQAQARQLGVDIRPEHLWNAVKRLLKAGNVRNPDLFFPNPAQAEEGAEEQEAPPSPEMAKAQGELQLKQQEQFGKMQLAQQQAEAEFAMQQQRFQFESQLAVYKTQLEAGLAQEAAATEARLNEMAMQEKMDLERFKAVSKAQTDTMKAAISAKSISDKANGKISNVRLGGELG